MPVLNALEGCWTLLIFSVAFFWYPIHLFPQPRNCDRLLRIASNWVRMGVAITVSIFFLSRVAGLSAIILMMLFVLPVTVVLFKKAKYTSDWRNSLQAIAIRVVRHLETWRL